MQALITMRAALRRENDPPTTICAALLVLLLQKWSLLSVGLQLSFAERRGSSSLRSGLYRAFSENQFPRLLHPKRFSARFAPC